MDVLSSFFGDANFALTAAAAASAITYLRIRSLSRDVWSDELVEALHSGGHIGAITGGGGAFGAMLGQSGVGEYVATYLDSVGLPLLLAGFVIAAAMRIAQGSATVAILTGAGIMAPFVPDLAVHPVYLALAIGAGGATLSWQNNSGFWVIKEIGGLTQLETVKIHTVLTTINSIVGFVLILILSTLFPLT